MSEPRAAGVAAAAHESPSSAREPPAVARVRPDLDATLVLVRHGESTWVAAGRVQGQQDAPLSTLGREQAGLVAARLAVPLASPPLPVPSSRPAGVWHSPLSRAAETARAIAAGWTPRLDLTPDERLREIGQGEWEGLTGAEVRARYGDVQRAWRRDPVGAHAPGGESLDEVALRATSFAERLLDGLADARRPGAGTTPSATAPTLAPAGRGEPPWAMVVAHEGLLRVLLLSLLGLPLDAFWRFPFGLCGISVIDVRSGRAVLRAHNLLEHLAPLGATALADATADRGAGL